ncbi:MAG: signal peptide peptidase SppA [Nanoarchaeota archaeon]|nr:signal peptide peptidase SppA [Nanoarchaeota archaeon]MBU1632203.1 signal peptide peptidase SppA [Nanoarchaeota archaeon]
MKKMVGKTNKARSVFLTVAAVLVIVFIILPLIFSVFDRSKTGNVALIPITGAITGDGGKFLGTSTVSSNIVVDYIKEADENKQIKVILLEINSPGGSAVASDEIASAVKKAKKPVVALIREAGASGAYWIASAADHIIANRMSITGSIGVISSYLEFSGLMKEYGVGYEKLVAGERKDIGTPFRKLDDSEKKILQSKLDKIHLFFIKEVAENRNLSLSDVESLATGEFYLGIEAYYLGLVDQLGDKDTAEEYIKDNYKLEKIDYLVYERKASIFDIFSNVFSDFFFKIGEGFGSILVSKENNLMLV